MPKRKTELITWFNHKLFDDLCEKMKKNKKDLKIFSENLGVSFDTIYRIRTKKREPIFSMVAKLIKLFPEIPAERWTVKPKKHKFVRMDRNIGGRKFQSAVVAPTVKSMTENINKRNPTNIKKLL